MNIKYYDDYYKLWFWFFMKNSCNLNVFLIFFSGKIPFCSQQMIVFFNFSLEKKNWKIKRKLEMEKENNFLLVNEPLFSLAVFFNLSMFLNVLILSWNGCCVFNIYVGLTIFWFLLFNFPCIKFQRPTAKELLRHRFIRNARKSPRLLERIRCDILLLSIALGCCIPTKTNMVAEAFFFLPSFSPLSILFYFLMSVSRI
jgi:hypothetical protein